MKICIRETIFKGDVCFYCTKNRLNFATKRGKTDIFQKAIALLFIMMYNYSANEISLLIGCE